MIHLMVPNATLQWLRPVVIATTILALAGSRGPVTGTRASPPPGFGVLTTAGVFHPASSAFFLRHSSTSGPADAVFAFGPGGAGWLPVVGDWNADGVDSAGLYSPTTGAWYLRHAQTAGVADLTFTYGPAGSGWQPVVGDWNADGVDTVGLYNPATGVWYLRNTNSAGVADLTFIFGPAGVGWQPVVGDWNADGVDSAGLYNPATGVRYLRNTHTTGVADLQHSFGPGGAGWVPQAGDWDGPDPILVGAGDIASCQSTGDEATALLLDINPGTVFTTGDNAYDVGSDLEFNNCYGPTWGRHKARTRPAPGNHDYATPGGAGYFAYFGAAAGDPAKGYYSYDLGSWHLIIINSNCGDVGGCGSGSPQVQWLQSDLAAHPAFCVAAFWHHPRFSSGPHGSQSSMSTIWQTLYDQGADLVLTGHDHLYERFTPQNATGGADPARGVRQITVGTGGRNHYAVASVAANSEVRDSTSFGVLRLVLGSKAYFWEFLPVQGASFRDTGSTACH